MLQNFYIDSGTQPLRRPKTRLLWWQSGRLPVNPEELPGSPKVGLNQ